jgi:uncharacterized protein DUF4238
MAQALVTSSKAMASEAPARPAKKRHHYVPVTYLRGFTADDGQLFVYRKDDPSTELRIAPQAALFRNFYYSQPTTDGGRDDQRIEDLFSSVEQDWPKLADSLRNRSPMVPAQVSRLFEYLAMQRTRVPAARDMAETILAHRVMAEARALDAAGMLPPPPPEVPEILEETVVAIDPHMSIHAMVEMTRALAPAFDAVGLEVLHNETPVSLITSDNPVLIFDPGVPERKMRPYVIDPAARSVELLFPVDRHTLLRGHSSLRADFARHGIQHRRLKSADSVRRANRLVARFAYEMLVACDASHAALARAYADQSPVLGKAPREPDGLGKGRLAMTFGRRAAKPKWERPKKR